MKNYIIKYDISKVINLIIDIFYFIFKKLKYIF